MNLKEKIKQQLFDKKGYISSRKLAKISKDFLEEINNYYLPNFLETSSLQEKIHWILTDRTDYNKCPVCGKNITTFRCITEGYTVSFCNIKCHYQNRTNNKKEKKKLSLDDFKQAKDKQLEKANKTCLEKYGVKFPFQSKEITEKRFKTRHKNWFETRIIELKNIAVPLFSYEDYIGSKKYYQWKCVKCSSIFEGTIANGSIPKCHKCFEKIVSKPHQEIINYLFELDDTLEVIVNDRRQIYPLEIDIYLPEFNLGIEVNGVYWHSEKSNGFSKNHLFEKQQKGLDKNIEIIFIQDIDWYNKTNIIKSFLANKLNKNNKIFARKCEIKELTHKNAKQFLSENHLQGKDNASIYLGLYHENELVSAMSFGKSRYNKQYEWELIRFTNKLNHNVIGGASKLLSYFEKTYNPKSIISYSNNMIGIGNLYKKLNFIFDGECGIGFNYLTPNNTIINRQQLQKHKLKNIFNYDEQLSTEENRNKNGYFKIWNAGNKRWIKTY